MSSTYSLFTHADTPVENMGPGRFGPVLYRTNNEKKELRAMRVAHTIYLKDCILNPAMVVGSHSVVYKV